MRLSECPKSKNTANTVTQAWVRIEPNPINLVFPTLGTKVAINMNTTEDLYFKNNISAKHCSYHIVLLSLLAFEVLETKLEASGMPANARYH